MSIIYGDFPDHFAQENNEEKRLNAGAHPSASYVTASYLHVADVKGIVRCEIRS